MPENVERGRRLRDSIAIAHKELGFDKRLPQIRKDSHAWFLTRQQQLLAERIPSKASRELALAKRKQFLAQAKGKRLIEPSKRVLTTLKPQSEPTHVEPPSQDMILYGSTAVTGSGLGFNPNALATLILVPILGLGALRSLIAGARFEAIAAAWRFRFTAPSDGWYRFSVGLIGWGNYVVISDDGPFDSHEVEANLTGTLGPTQTAFFDRNGANIDEKDTFVGARRVEYRPWCDAGQTVDLTASLLATVAARGDDTFAQMDMTQPVGGMMCTGLTVG